MIAAYNWKRFELHKILVCWFSFFYKEIYKKQVHILNFKTHLSKNTFKSVTLLLKEISWKIEFIYKNAYNTLRFRQTISIHTTFESVRCWEDFKFLIETLSHFNIFGKEHFFFPLDKTFYSWIAEVIHSLKMRSLLADKNISGKIYAQQIPIE